MGPHGSEGDQMPQVPRSKIGFLRLVALARPEFKMLFWGTLMLVASSAMGLLYPQAVRVFVDDAVKSGDHTQLNRAAGAMFIIFLVQSLTAAARYFWFTIAGERIVMHLRNRLYETILHQEMDFFDRNRTGDLLSRLASDATILQNAASVNISMLVRSLAMVAGGTALLFWTSPKLTALMLASVPPVALGAAWFGGRVKRLSRVAQDKQGLASTVAEETISGIRTVRSFAAESREELRYGDALMQSFQTARKRIRLISTFMASASVLGLTSVTAVIWYGGMLVMNGQLTLGNLTAFILYTISTAISLGTLGSLWTDFMSALGAAQRIFDVLDRTPLIERSNEVPAGKAGLIIDRNLDGDVSFDHVNFAYPSRADIQVLHDFTLHISPGEVVALVGPSGAGKSTVASLATRFYDPQSGAIYFDGVKLTDLDPHWLRRQIGVVAQDPVLMSSSIRENIAYGRPEASHDEIRAAATAAHVDLFVQQFPEGYETLVGERGIQLSGGQKQRVAIARAILRDPKLLILDEATSALDAESEFYVQSALEKLMVGRSTLVIAHRLSTIRKAHRIIVMAEGRIVQSGTHDSLLRDENGTYAKLVMRQLNQNLT